ncbi:cache domain-containing sensor histidine kinase [Paenibacillus periandrae]|uniref:cache domain-containing sensor histidine kinase n=1 Tax=Paenibacillus periandrae TaxID=1761741 RepID=UPI001F08D5E4|nr:sensor histidine kinase [Paenibacillus periandrae]
MRFFQKSIRHKLTVLLLISTIVPITSSIFITDSYTKESLKERAIEENTHLISEGKANIINYLDTVKSASLTIYSNATLDSILTKGFADYRSESYIFTIMQIVSRSANDIYQVYLNISDNQSSYVLYQNNFKRGPIRYEPPANRALAPYAVFTEGTHRSHDYGIIQAPMAVPEKVFTIHRPFYRVPSNEQIGLLSIDVKLEALSKLTAQLYEKNKEDLYILDETGAIIYVGNETYLGSAPTEAWIKQLLDNPDDAGYMEWNQREFSGIMIYTKLSTSYLNWTLVKRIPYSHLYEYARNLTFINTIVAAIFLTIAMIAVLMVSLRLTRPLKQLISHINNIQAGQLEETIVINRTDEIGILAKRFRTMMHTINDLILREYKLNLANKTIQLEVLQAQINPHFMNNALQSIGNLALESHAPQVYTLISSLGQMMHYSMNTKETIVPLSMEIDYVNYYCMLQQQRFEDKLSFEFDICEQTSSFQVPKMIVQPIVENFFKHGFYITNKRVGVVKVSTRIEKARLLIIVEDNGIGVSDERLQQLRHKLTHLDESGERLGESIGLMNIMSRLRLYYGDQANLELDSIHPYGLQVILSIPIMGIDKGAL